MSARSLVWTFFLAMETLWLYAGIALLVSGADRPQTPSPLAVAAALLTGYGGARLARRLDFSEARAAAVGLGASCMLLVVILRLTYAGDLAVWRLGLLIELLTDPGGTLRANPGGMAGGLALCGVWLRGAWLGGPDIDDESVVAKSFGLGVVVVGIGIAIGELSGTDVPRRAALPFALFGLTAVALSRPGLVGAAPGGRPPRWWWKLLMVGLAAALIIAGTLAVLPWSLLLEPLAPAGKAAGWAFTWLAIILVTPIYYAVLFILRGLVELFQAAGISLPVASEEQLREMEEAARERDAHSPLDWLLSVIRYVLIVITAIVFLALASRPFRRRFGLGREAPDRLAISAQSRVGGRKRWFDRFRSGGSAGLGGGAVGKLYGEVLRESEQRGLPRPLQRTPLEFAPEAVDHLGMPVVQEISEAFARACYGGRSVDKREVERLRNEFRHELAAASQ